MQQAEQERFCFVYCGKHAPECVCIAGMERLPPEFEAAIFDNLDELYVCDEKDDHEHQGNHRQGRS